VPKLPKTETVSIISVCGKVYLSIRISLQRKGKLGKYWPRRLKARKLAGEVNLIIVNRKIVNKRSYGYSVTNQGTHKSEDTKSFRSAAVLAVGSGSP